MAIKLLYIILLSIRIKDCDISELSSAKNIEVMIEENLNYKKHVNKLLTNAYIIIKRTDKFKNLYKYVNSYFYLVKVVV